MCGGVNKKLPSSANQTVRTNRSSSHTSGDHHDASVATVAESSRQHYTRGSFAPGLRCSTTLLPFALRTELPVPTPDAMAGVADGKSGFAEDDDMVLSQDDVGSDEDSNGDSIPVHGMLAGAVWRVLRCCERAVAQSCPLVPCSGGTDAPAVIHTGTGCP